MEKVVGRVVVPVKIENLSDLYDAEKGSLAKENVRRIEVADALVDTGANSLGLPSRMVDQLGLKRRRKRRALTVGGFVELALCDVVRLTINGRDCAVEVSELPDNCPVLVGQIPLEHMDWVVDPKNQRLIGNPEHDGKWMVEFFFEPNFFPSHP